MAQNLAPKEQGYVTRLSAAAVALLATADLCTSLTTEFTDDTYGTGGANALTDAVVQAVLPGATAAQVSSAEAALVSVLSSISSNRGSLEFLRP